MPKRRCSRSLAHKDTSDAAAKRTRRQGNAKQRDSRLVLAFIIWPATCKYHCRAIKVLSWKHSCQSAVEGLLSKKCRSSASLLVIYIYIYICT